MSATRNHDKTHTLTSKISCHLIIGGKINRISNNQGTINSPTQGSISGCWVKLKTSWGITSRLTPRAEEHAAAKSKVALLEHPLLKVLIRHLKSF